MEVRMLELPFYQQQDDHSCGFIAVLTVVRYFFPALDPARVRTVVGATAQDGCDQERVLGALGAFGIRAHIQEDLGLDDLFDLTTHGKPVIVTVWPDDWGCDHWAVVRGIDRSGKRIHLINYNQSARNGIPWDEFASVWEPAHYGLVCLNPVLTTEERLDG